MTHPHTLNGPLADLATAIAAETGVGGVTALSKALGVSKMTVWRWGHADVVPGPHTIKLVNDMCRARGIAPVWGDT